MGQASAGWADVRSLLLVDPLRQTSAPAEADAVIVDLPAPAGGPSAERLAALAGDLRARRPGARLLVRIAALRHESLDLDLDTAMPARPDAVVLPDPSGGPCLQRLGTAVAVREARLGLPAWSTGIVAQCGATGLLRPPALAGASPRLVALMWDAALLGADMGARAAFEGAAPRAVARTLLRLAAAAAGVPAFDTASDEAPPRFVAECRAARALGYAGKVAARASQIGDIHATFGAPPPP